MELNEMEKKLLFQVEGDYQTKILNELYMTVRYSNNSEQREAAEGLMAKLRVLSNAECMDLVKDIQKNYRLPYPARTIGEKIAEARQQSGAEKLKGHDIMALERFDPEVKHMWGKPCRDLCGKWNDDPLWRPDFLCKHQYKLLAAAFLYIWASALTDWR